MLQLKNGHCFSDSTFHHVMLMDVLTKYNATKDIASVSMKMEFLIKAVL